MPRRALIGLVLGLATLLAACLSPTVNPGPDPARVAVAARRGLSAEQVSAAKAELEPLPGSMVRREQIAGPFWRISAQQKQPDGSWRSLPLAPDQPALPGGRRIAATRTFLAPPGAQTLRLRLEAWIERTWQELTSDPHVQRRSSDGRAYRLYSPNWRDRSAEIYLLDLRPEQGLDLQPGQEVALEPFK